MSGIAKISDALSLALHGAAYLAAGNGEFVATGTMARELGVSEAHLHKVLAILERAALVEGRRGPGGGFRLSKAPRAITLMHVYEAMEGKLKPTRCLLERRVCRGGCILGDLLRSVDRQVAARLGATRLSDVAGRLRRGRPGAGRPGGGGERRET